MYATDSRAGYGNTPGNNINSCKAIRPNAQHPFLIAVDRQPEFAQELFITANLPRERQSLER
jgi:hypothetical protein